MSRIADPLRKLVHDMYKAGAIGLNEREALLLVSDQIDREHDVRMRQSRDSTRKAACRYMTRVVEDYKHGRKWQRKEYGCAR